MARIGYEDGSYVGLGTFEERHLWKQYGFQWKPLKKRWVAPTLAIAQKVPNVYWMEAAVEAAAKASEVADVSYDMSFKGSTDFHVPISEAVRKKGWDFMPFQKAGIEYATMRRDTLIGDQPGLGKTIQAIGCQNVDPGLRKTLVIVPASLKENWRREWVLWGSHDYSVGVAETQRKTKVRDGYYKNGKMKWKTVVDEAYFPTTDVVIINYDILDRFPQIWEMQWDYLVCDECHALKSDESKRTLYVLGGWKRDKTVKPKGGYWIKAVEADVRVFLSGTPMLNRPIELWPICKAFDPGDLGRDKEAFGYRYCAGYTDPGGRLNFSGSSNLEELQELLRQKFMVRRFKKQVLPELPDKTRVVLTLDSPEIKELVARESELAEALGLFEQMVKGSVEETEAAEGLMISERAVRMGIAEAYAVGEGDNAASVHMLDMDYATAVSGLEPPAVAVAFEEIALVRRELGIAKLPVVLSWVKTFLDGGEKLVLFGYHTDVIEGLIEGLKDYNPAYIYGKVALKRRQEMVDAFQNDDGCRVIIGNIHAMGVGHTLVRAWNVAFAEGDWTPALMEQCEDRVCRIGQESEKIFSYHLVANGSLDARIAQSAKDKSDNIEKAIG